MMIIRGTKKLRDRAKGRPAGDGDVSTAELGDWFATALFWRPQVALFVNTRTFIPVFMELTPAATLLDRTPSAIEEVLRRHSVDDEFVAAERAAMADERIAPTNDRSVLGVMNEFASLGDPAVPAPASGSVYQLKVTLHDTKPPIWRRVLVDGASTLDHVHEVIQEAFGWWNYHLHEFEVGDMRYGVPDPDADCGLPINDESTVRLDSIAGEGSKLEYVYDFGDWWRHKIVVEKVLPADPTTTVPACVDGRRACPPEDCGGTWGYRELVEILADPAHPEHDERQEWIGRTFDPEAFDLSEFEDNLRNQHLAASDDWP